MRAHPVPTLFLQSVACLVPSFVLGCGSTHGGAAGSASEGGAASDADAAPSADAVAVDSSSTGKTQVDAAEADGPPAAPIADAAVEGGDEPPAPLAADTGSACPASSGAGTLHSGEIAADETWGALTGPHIVTGPLRLRGNATLTIAPCAQVRIRGGHSIYVQDSATLTAQGTPSGPIAIGADDPTQPWGFIQIFAPATARFAYATLDNGLADRSMTQAYGMIEARGNQDAPAQEVLKVDHVTVRNSGGYGVSLRAGGAFTRDSEALTITGSAQQPIRILPRLAGNLPTGSYTGNRDDTIDVETEAGGEVNFEDVTFHDRGVPYRIGGDQKGDTRGELRVGPKHYTLTLEPGVTLGFKPGASRLLVDFSPHSTSGVLVAQGTAAKPIVFTSGADVPARGDWIGIQFGEIIDPATVMNHIQILFAGGATTANSYHCLPDGSYSRNEDAAIWFAQQPPAGILANSAIVESAGVGVNLGYYGSYVDFLSTNMFESIAGCKISYPRDTSGACPSSVPCP